MTDEEMVIALRKHADLIAQTDDPDTATALRWAASRIADLSASRARLLSLVRVLLVNDPNDMAADGITMLDVWRKTASIAVAKAEGAVLMAEKLTKDDARYQDKPKEGQRCKHCTMFHHSKSCTAVKGAISTFGWCKLYYEEIKA